MKMVEDQFHGILLGVSIMKDKILIILGQWWICVMTERVEAETQGNGHINRIKFSEIL